MSFLGLYPHQMEAPRLGVNRSCSYGPTPQPQQRQIWAVSTTYTTADGNAGSLTRRARPGIESATSWFLVRFVNHCATMGTPERPFWRAMFNHWHFPFWEFLFVCFSYGHTCSIWKFPGQGSNWSCSGQPMPQPQQCQIQATSATYASFCSNARSLTHWTRSGIEPTSSQRRHQILHLLSPNGNSWEVFIDFLKLFGGSKFTPNRISYH